MVIPVAHWLVVDAILDNEISVEGEHGDPRHVLDLAHTIRQAGWDHLPDWPTDPAGFADSPQPGQTVTMPLTHTQWDLILDCLDRWAAVAADLETPNSRADARQSRQIADQLRHQLTEHDNRRNDRT